MLFNKVLGENEKCVFYFYLKTEGTFWLIQYQLSFLGILLGRGKEEPRSMCFLMMVMKFYSMIPEV